jgi:hypothetical protein
MFKFSSPLPAFILALSAHAQQAPAIEWQRCLGGSGGDGAAAVEQTSDGGFVVAGSTNSNDGDIVGNHGSTDIWVVKLGQEEEIQWQRCLGGSAFDAVASIDQTVDGGYILAGHTSSNDGDVSGHHGGTDPYDAWVVKLTASGEVQWQRCLGGSHDDVGRSIKQTTDGGYIFLGTTSSGDGDVSGNHGPGSDIWVVKLNGAGNIEWQRCLGGSSGESAGTIQQTLDGGYFLVGSTSSTNGDVSGNHGATDAWVVRLDADGGIEWQQCLGGSAMDRGFAGRQAVDGGFVMVGMTASSDGDVTGYHGAGDGWAVKLGPGGGVEWTQCLGGGDLEEMNAVDVLSDGYVLTGYTHSNDGDITDHQGGSDIWVVNLNEDGTMAWQRSLGGSGNEIGYDVRATVDGGLVLVGFSSSTDGDVSGNNGGGDAWVVKLAADPLAATNPSRTPLFALFPNPTHGELTLSLAWETPPPIHIELYNVAGQRLMHQASTPAGERQLQFSIKDLPAGIYYVRAEIDGRVTTQKVVKL